MTNGFGNVNDNMDYEKETYDIENFGDNVRLRPDYYVHLVLQQLTRVFEGEVTEEEGFKKYIHLVHHMEILVRAAKMLPKNYSEEVKKLKKTEKYSSLGKLEQETYIAREKLNLFIANVFSRSPAGGALYLYENGDGSTSKAKEAYEKSKKN